MIGVPYSRGLRENQWSPERGLFEHEAARLARCLAPLGDAELGDARSWNLRITPREEQTAGEHLAGWEGRSAFFALGVGFKAPVKDWGAENWSTLLGRLGGVFPDHGLVLVGSADESGLAQGIARAWKGPVLNLCGTLTPRESAAALRKAEIFIGHDGGPMHLASAVGTVCVAVFSARSRPGVWYPYGEQHRVLYHQTPCFGCELETCVRYQRECIRSITVDEVYAAVLQAAASRSIRRVDGYLGAR